MWNEEILISIYNDIQNLKKEIKEIKEKMNEIETSTNNMDKHITFVESVYTTVKSPFHFLLNTVEIIRKRTSLSPLPSIENNNNNELNDNIET